MSRSSVIKLSTVKEPKYIVDYLKANSPVKVDFSTLKHLTRRDKTNKTIVAYNPPTINMRVQLFDTKSHANIFKPYDVDNKELESKVTQKVNVGFGKIDESNQSLFEKIFRISYSIAEAIDYYYISRFTKVEIESTDTDESFLDKVCKSIDFKKANSDYYQDYINHINGSRIYVSSSDSDEQYRIMSIFRRNIVNMIKSKKLIIDDATIAKLFASSDSFKPSSFPFSFIEKTNADTNEDYKLFNGKLTFIFSTGKNDRFSSKIIQKKVITPMTYNKYIEVASSKARKECNFVCDILYSIKTFSAKTFNQLRFEVKQCLVDEVEQEKAEEIMFDLDEEYEDIQADEFLIDEE